MNYKVIERGPHFHNLGGENESGQWQETEEEAQRRGEVAGLSGV